MKTNRLQVRVMLLLGVAVCLILPGVLASRALRTAHAGATGALRQDRPGEALDAARVAALTKLQAELKAGAPFSHEETDILGRFSAGGAVDAFEADVLISRVLYAYSIGNDLSADGQELLDRYKEHIAPGKINTADLKAHIQAIELKETPRAPAVAPSNDLCAGAEVIPAAGPFPYLTAVTADITDATVTGDPPLPSCQTSVSRSIWYTFTPSATSSYTISSCADAPTGSTVDDTVIAVYTSTGGCAGTFTEIPTAGLSDGCDDDTCITESLQSVLTTSLTSGTQYFIVVSKFGLTAPTAGNTAVQLRISQPLSPANETCAGAIPLTLNTAVSGTTNGATGNDYQLTGTTCFTGIGQTSSTAPGRDVVYSFTAPSAGNYSFTINFVNGFNAVLYVSTSCPAATPGTPVNITCDNVSGPVIAASNRNTSTTNAAESVQCLALTNGQQVFVFVDETALSGAGGSFIIKVTQCLTATGNDVEPNGTPATANALACGAQGGIVPAGDVDFYTLGTPATGSRVFAMAEGASASSSDFDMRITTTTDTLEYDDANLDTPFGSLAPVAAGTPLTGVASFIRMNHFTAATQSEPYRLYSVVQPPGAGLGGSSATAETEPNDTTPNANSATNNFFSGLAAGDVDMFCFGATAGDVVFIALDTDPLRNNTPFNGALALLSSTGTVLVSVNDGGSTSSTTTGAGSLTATTPNSPAEGIVFTIQTTGNYIARVTVGGGTPSATSDYLLSISKNCALGGGGCAAAACTSITCPANVTQPNDPNQCGAVVTYPAPTSSGTCGTINCSPASGSFFPVGTTTVTCTS
ncbi:MAG: HYR domain-containing protein, partial [Acidobacteriota bacterium]